MVTLLVLGWIVCGVMAYGLLLGYTEARWGDISYGQERFNQSMSVLMALFGPITLVIGFLMSEFGRYGFRWAAPTREEARAAYRRAFPSIYEKKRREVEG